MLPLRKYHLLLFNYMTMRQRTINNLIEISPQAEGSFLTQAFPTNFHQFYTKKLLTPQESVSDYKEVTAAEKANIINTDSQWVEPSEELKATAKAVGADYNVKTGYFEYNTLTDITTAQMRAILYTPWNVYNNRVQCPTNIRTNICCYQTFTRYYDPGDYVSLLSTFINTQLEVLRLCENDAYIAVNDISMAFYGSKKLRTIIGTIMLSPSVAITLSRVSNPFGQCSALENIRLSYLSINISFADSPLLSLTSIQYMVDHAANTSPITITLYPDAYARLTDELIAKAAEKQITFATTS